MSIQDSLPGIQLKSIESTLDQKGSITELADELAILDIRSSSVKNENKSKKKRKVKKKSVDSISRFKVGREVDKPQINIPFLKLGIKNVDTGRPVKLTILGDGSIDLHGSWDNLIIMLITMLYENSPLDFTSNLIKYKIMNDGLLVHHSYVRYPHIENFKYAVYKLKNKEVYIEIRENAEVYLTALKGLFLSLGIHLDDISFDLIPMGEAILNNKYNSIDRVIKTILLTDIVSDRIFDIDVCGISILGYKQSCKDLSQAMQLFMMWANEQYGKTFISAATSISNDAVGLGSASKISEFGVGYTICKIGNNYYYSTDDRCSNLIYLCSLVIKLGISPDCIEIEYNTYELKQ